MRTSKFFAILFLSPAAVFAQALKVPASTGGSAAQVMFGLGVVLSVIAVLAWLLKKFNLTKITGQSLALIVSTVSVGTRERVVVIEVGGRWLVVGVAAGQVSSIANLDIVVDPVHEAIQKQQASWKNAQAEKGITDISPLQHANPALTSFLKKILDKDSTPS